MDVHDLHWTRFINPYIQMLVLKAKGDRLGNNRIQLDHPMGLWFQKYMFWHLRDRKRMPDPN